MLKNIEEIERRKNMDLSWPIMLGFFLIIIIGMYVWLGKGIVTDYKNKAYKSNPENVLVYSVAIIVLTYALNCLITGFPCRIETITTAEASVMSLGTQYFIDYEGNQEEATTVTYVPRKENEKYEIEITKFRSLTGKLVHTRYDLYVPAEEKILQ